MQSRFRDVEIVKISTVDKRILRDFARYSAYLDKEMCAYIYGIVKGRAYVVEGAGFVFGKPFEDTNHKGIYVDGVPKAIKSFNRQFPGYAFASFHTHPNSGERTCTPADIKSNPVGGLEFIASCDARSNGSKRAAHFFNEYLDAYKILKVGGRKVAEKVEVRRL